MIGSKVTLAQNASSLALRFWERDCFEDLEEKDDLISQ